MIRRNQPPLRNTPLKRHTSLRRKPHQPTPEDPQLTEYYNRGIRVSTWICENCGEYIPNSEVWQLYAAQCHILDKEKYPEVRGHFLNRLHLCLRCHVDWDSSWKKAASMKVFTLAKTLVAGFAHLVKKLPNMFSNT